MNEATLWTKLGRGWQQFFFGPTSPTPMGLFRICIGLITLQLLCVHLLADWSLYYGDHPLITIETTIAHYWGENPYFDLMLFLPHGEIWRWYFFWFTVAMAVMMTLGLFTRFSSVATFLCVLSLQQHFLLNQNSGDNFLRIALMFTAMSNAGDAFSLDNLIKSLRQDWRLTGFRAPLSAPWAQRLVQLQLTIAYGHTWLCKIKGDDWNDGIAVYYASRYDDIIRFPLPFLLDNMFCIQMLTWGTLIVEFALFTLIWWRPARYWVLLFGVALHMGIEYTMNLPMFEWLFMISLLTFVYPEDFSKAMDMIKLFVHKYIAKPCDLVFDGDCVFCVRSVGFIHRLDIFGLVNLWDNRHLEDYEYKQEVNLERAEKEALVRTSSGKWLGGFEAFRHMAWRLPWQMPLAPFLYLPGVAQVGDITYKWIANHRSLLMGGKCSHKVCTPVTK